MRFIRYILPHLVIAMALGLLVIAVLDSFNPTMAFLTMSMAEIFHCFNLRSQRDSLFSLHTHNRLLNLAAAASFAATTAVIYVPSLSGAFGFAHISLAEYLLAMGLALCVIPLVETVKFFQRKAGK